MTLAELGRRVKFGSWPSLGVGLGVLGVLAELRAVLFVGAR